MIQCCFLSCLQDLRFCLCSGFWTSSLVLAFAFQTLFGLNKYTSFSRVADSLDILGHPSLVVSALKMTFHHPSKFRNIYNLQLLAASPSVILLQYFRFCLQCKWSSWRMGNSIFPNKSLGTNIWREWKMHQPSEFWMNAFKAEFCSNFK